MISIILFALFGCGEKEQDTASSEVADTAAAPEDTSSESGEETGGEDTSEGEDTSSEGGDTAAQ